MAIRLDYGPDGTLRRYQLATASHDLQEPVAFESDGVNLSQEYEGDPAVDQLDRGDLLPTAAAPPPPFPQHARARTPASQP